MGEGWLVLLVVMVVVGVVVVVHGDGVQIVNHCLPPVPLTWGNRCSEGVVCNNRGRPLLGGRGDENRTPGLYIYT